MCCTACQWACAVSRRVAATGAQIGCAALARGARVPAACPLGGCVAGELALFLAPSAPSEELPVGAATTPLAAAKSAEKAAAAAQASLNNASSASLQTVGADASLRAEQLGWICTLNLFAHSAGWVCGCAAACVALSPAAAMAGKRASSHGSRAASYPPGSCASMHAVVKGASCLACMLCCMTYSATAKRTQI
jgi:hypothetical protein